MADDCIEFAGAKDNHGYGKLSYNGITVNAHRLSYSLFNGPLTRWDVVRHTCDNPPCINPAHLVKGTQSDNMNDAIERGRNWWLTRTHCKNGHEFTDENTQWVVRRGRLNRRCRTCKNAAGQRRRDRKKAEAQGDL